MKKLKYLTISAQIILIYFILGSACWSGLWDEGKKTLQDFMQPGKSSDLSDQEIGSGLKEALRVGTANVVQELGRIDGFNANPEVHIPLPPAMSRVQSVLKKTGYSSLLDDLELKLNRAAEHATPKAKELFWQAISSMTWEDVRKIYNGPKDAATRYFQRETSGPLKAEMKPIVDRSLSETGAVQAYDRVMNKYRSIPLVPDVKSDLVEYTLDQALEGIFKILAREEAAIRNEPAKRTTEILKKVFGKK